jgi:hypothetical protein
MVPSSFIVEIAFYTYRFVRHLVIRVLDESRRKSGAALPVTLGPLASIDDRLREICIIIGQESHKRESTKHSLAIYKANKEEAVFDRSNSGKL